MSKRIEIPSMDEENHLRWVEMDGFVLQTWDTERHAQTGQRLLGYALWAPGDFYNGKEPIFCGDDFGCSPMYAVDSDNALRGLMGFLTLRPGDTDSDYFKDYTVEQWRFQRENAEALSVWAMDCDDEDNGFPPPFKNLDGWDEP